MKVNLLHMIIITTTFNSLQIHASENPQQANNLTLVVSNSTHMLNSNNNTINGTTYNSAAHTNPLSSSSSSSSTMTPPRILTSGQVDLHEIPLDKETHPILTKHKKEPKKTLFLFAYGEDRYRSEEDLFEQESNIKMHCCNNIDVVCTRCFLSVGIGGTLTVVGSIVLVALAMAGVF